MPIKQLSDINVILLDNLLTYLFYGLCVMLVGWALWHFEQWTGLAMLIGTGAVIIVCATAIGFLVYHTKEWVKSRV